MPNPTRRQRERVSRRKLNLRDVRRQLAALAIEMADTDPESVAIEFVNESACQLLLQYGLLLKKAVPNG